MSKDGYFCSFCILGHCNFQMQNNMKLSTQSCVRICYLEKVCLSGALEHKYFGVRCSWSQMAVFYSRVTTTDKYGNTSEEESLMEIWAKRSYSISEKSTLVTNQGTKRFQYFGDDVQVYHHRTITISLIGSSSTATPWDVHFGMSMLLTTHLQLWLTVPVTKTFIGTLAFRSAASDIWNKLLDDVVKFYFLFLTIFG